MQPQVVDFKSVFIKATMFMAALKTINDEVINQRDMKLCAVC